MRKSLLLAALLVAAPTAAHAQFGIKGGFTFSSIDINNGTVDFNTKTGFVGGVSYGLQLGESWGIQPELLYIEKGGESGNGDVSSSYAEVPVLARFMAATGRIQPFLLGGGYAGFKLADDCTVKQAGECLGDLETTDFGLSLGAGLRFGGTTGITVEIRWDRGLVNINTTEGEGDARNRTVMLMAGLSF